MRANLSFFFLILVPFIVVKSLDSSPEFQEVTSKKKKKKRRCDECRDRRELLSILRLIRVIMMIDIPSHTAPFPVNPSLQVQLYEPSVFVHSAFSPHGSISAEHSSRSDMINMR